MKNIKVDLGRLVRQGVDVVLSVPDDFESWSDDKKNTALNKVLNGILRDSHCPLKVDWSGETPDSHVLGEIECEADFVLTKKGTVKGSQEDTYHLPDAVPRLHCNTVPVAVNGAVVQVDEGISRVVELLNLFPGVTTLDSCQGGDEGFASYVSFCLKENSAIGDKVLQYVFGHLLATHGCGEMLSLDIVRHRSGEVDGEDREVSVYVIRTSSLDSLTSALERSMAAYIKTELYGQ